LIRKFTRPVIENLIPEAHVRLVRGILKEERYQKNKVELEREYYFGYFKLKRTTTKMLII
jgi:hypothetical protein